MINFERVTIDRATRQVTSELIWPMSPQVLMIKEKGVLEGLDDGKTIHEHYVYETSGIKTWKVEMFK